MTKLEEPARPESANSYGGGVQTSSGTKMSLISKFLISLEKMMGVLVYLEQRVALEVAEG